MERYSRGTVAYLLGLSHQDAIDDDTAQTDSCARLTQDPELAVTTHAEWDPVFTTAKWGDVHRTRDRILRGEGVTREQLLVETVIVGLRSQGYTLSEIERCVGVDRMRVARLFRGRLKQILDELGGEADPAQERTSSVPACMKCGQRPRARIAETSQRVKGKPRRVWPERQSSLCVRCHPVDALRGLVQTREVALRRIAEDPSVNMPASEAA